MRELDDSDGGESYGARIGALARRLLALCASQEIKLALAESCTGGMVAAALTDIPGSSSGFDRGFVTYSNEAKQEMLGVNAETLTARGAVSRQTALEMAQGALSRSQAGLAISITGIAGPGGGSPQKPVGLVWFGLALAGGDAKAEQRIFPSDGRRAIRQAAAETALTLAVSALEERQAAGAP